MVIVPISHLLSSHKLNSLLSFEHFQPTVVISSGNLRFLEPGVQFPHAVVGRQGVLVTVADIATLHWISNAECFAQLRPELGRLNRSFDALQWHQCLARTQLGGQARFLDAHDLARS